MSDNKFQMVAKTFQGLEDVLSDELISLGAENVEAGRRMVSFEGDLALMYKANLCCRTALRILKPIEKFSASNPDELYDIVRDIDWEKYMTAETTFSIDSTVNSEEFSHSKYVTYRVKDGIVDHFRDKYGKRPSVRVSGAELMFNVHILEDRITISLDSSGESLAKRGYRVEQTAAPINEVLAAGIIMKTGWRGECDFADPMCGSGTFLVEAALIACNINPGIFRTEFAFEKWPDFDADLFEDIYNDDSREKDFIYKIYGGDIDPEAVAIARKNVRSAKVEDIVELSCRPMSDWTDNPEDGVLVMNPPYGERLKPDDLQALYRQIGTNLKKNFAGWHAWIIGLDNEDFFNIGLKPTVKIPLLNGSLACSLREYVLFGGRYNDFRAEGGSLGKEADEDLRRPRKMKHISDDEWKRETKRYGANDRPSKPRRDNGDRDRKGGSGGDRDRKGGSGGDRDRKGGFGGDRDRKGGFGGDRDRKGGFGGDRDRKGGFGGDRDRKGGFKGSDRKGGRFEDEDRQFNDRGRKPRKEYKVVNRGPQISADDAMVFSKIPVRSRRSKKQDFDSED